MVAGWCDIGLCPRQSSWPAIRIESNIRLRKNEDTTYEHFRIQRRGRTLVTGRHKDPFNRLPRWQYYDGLVARRDRCSNKEHKSIGFQWHRLRILHQARKSIPLNP